MAKQSPMAIIPATDTQAGMFTVKCETAEDAKRMARILIRAGLNAWASFNVIYWRNWQA